jgi:hypothetical protein
MTSHFLDGFGGTSLGYGKPFRGIITTTDTPAARQVLCGTINAEGRQEIPMHTSTVMQTLQLTPVEQEILWLIETRNSVYLVRQQTE